MLFYTFAHDYVKDRFEFAKKDKWGLCLTVILLNIQNIHGNSVERYESSKLSFTSEACVPRGMAFFLNKVLKLN